MNAFQLSLLKGEQCNKTKMFIVLLILHIKHNKTSELHESLHPTLSVDKVKTWLSRMQTKVGWGGGRESCRKKETWIIREI